MVASRVPGPQGVYAGIDLVDEGTSARMASPLPTTLGTAATTGAGATLPPPARAAAAALAPAAAAGPAPLAAAAGAGAGAAPATAIDNDTRMLAATAYGEGSVDDVFEEMAAIANVLVRQQTARGHASISAFVKADKTFAFAAHDGSERYAKLMAATPEAIAKDAGMAAALKAAVNALAEKPEDYANGAYFWDGADIKTNYANHAKVLGGIHFTDPKHNLYSIKEKQVPGENWLVDAQGKKLKSRGKWLYKYDSTAGWGGTIFWKYNADFLKASGNKAYR